MTEPFKFDVGDFVEKRSGYPWPGVVVSRFHTTEGHARYVVECTVREVYGALHIYNGNQLQRLGRRLGRK